jgi:PIN domain nuclease of toxin-antitoxin system
MPSVSNVNVIDASAILAYLQQEKGQDIVETALDAGPSWVTAVNYCEVLSKLRENGMPADEAQTAIDDLGLTVMDFDVDLARLAAAIRVRTMPIGASLGDRACLALARRITQTQATPIVYTAEQSWTKLKWPFKVVLIRPVPGGK